MRSTTLTESQILAMLGRYKAGEGKTALCNEYKIRSSRFDDFAAMHGVLGRGKGERLRTLREDAFDRLADEDSAYWYGFLLGDGSIVKRKGTWQISVTLQGRDLQHLEKLKKFLRAENKIGVYTKATGKKSCVFQFTSKRLGGALIRRGMTPQKSFTAEPLKETMANRHFWRGMVDADGTLGSYGGDTPGRRRLGLCGSREVVEAFSSWCQSKWGGAVPKVAPHCNIWYFTLNGEAASCIARALYANAAVFLDRKKEIADAWCD